MGLPELTFSLRAAAQTAATRIASGTAALILRDARAKGVYVVHRENDIPGKLGADNAAAVRRAMVGHINRPTAVYLCVIGPKDGIEDGFRALNGYSYDYLAGPTDISPEDAAALAELVKTQRELRYVGKAVLPNTAADHEGVVNFVAGNIQAPGGPFTAAAYCSRIAGMLAGTPADCSATYAALPEVTGVESVEDPDGAVDSGKLFLINDGRQIKLSRAVTSKVTLGPSEPEALKKIKLTAALDLIRYYAVTTVEDNYLGKCANNYDNKCLLVSALRDYLATLENSGAVASGTSGAELDAQAIRAWLLEQGGSTEEIERISALDDAALRKENTGSHVFLSLYGKTLDSMEDFHITLETG